MTTGAEGLLETIVDPLGRTISFAYDQLGRSIFQEEAGGGKWFFRYGNLSASVTAPNGKTTKHLFDPNLREVKRVLPDETARYQTWSNGFLASERSEFGGVTRYEYDQNGNVNLIQRPGDNAPTQITYDLDFNKPVLVQPPVGAPIHFTLNPGTGDVVQMARGGLSLAYVRDSFGGLLSTGNGKATYSDQRDGNGLLTGVFDLHNPEARAYDSRGRMTTRSFQSGRVMSYQYDDYDRVVAQTDSHGPTHWEHHGNPA